MLLTPADKLHRMEAGGCTAIGSRLTVDAARVGEEVAVDAHGGLYGSRVIDLSHDICLATQTVRRAHCVQAIPIDAIRRLAAVGLQGTTIVALNLAAVPMLCVWIALLIENALLMQVTPGGIEMPALAALLATRTGEYVLCRQLDHFLALTLDSETIGCHRSGGQHPGGTAPALIGHLGYIAGPLLYGVEFTWQIIRWIGQTCHRLDPIGGLLGAQAQAQTLAVLVAPPFVVFARRPAQPMNRIDAMDQLVVGQAQIRVALHPAAVQTTALVAIVPRGVVLVEIDAVVQAAEHRIRLIEAERTVVRTAVTGVIPIAKLIAIAQCCCK